MKKLLLIVAVILFLFTGCIEEVIIYPGDGPEFEASDVSIDFDDEYEIVTVKNENRIRAHVKISEEDTELGGFRCKFDETIGHNSEMCREVEGLDAGDIILIEIILEGFEDDPIIEKLILG